MQPKKQFNAVTGLNTPPLEDDINVPNPSANATVRDEVGKQILEMLKDICNEMRASRKRPSYDRRDDGNNQDSKKRSKKKGKRRRTNISKYCWSCGAWNHVSKYCRFKKDGHKDDATFDNKMGGALFIVKNAIRKNKMQDWMTNIISIYYVK